MAVGRLNELTDLRLFSEMEKQSWDEEMNESKQTQVSLLTEIDALKTQVQLVKQNETNLQTKLQESNSLALQIDKQLEELSKKKTDDTKQYQRTLRMIKWHIIEFIQQFRPGSLVL